MKTIVWTPPKRGLQRVPIQLIHAVGQPVGSTRGSIAFRKEDDRGRESRLVSVPLPPNRTCGSPTPGSPVAKALLHELGGTDGKAERVPASVTGRLQRLCRTWYRSNAPSADARTRQPRNSVGSAVQSLPQSAPACGASNLPDQKFCGECGSRHGAGVPAGTFAPPKSYTQTHLAQQGCDRPRRARRRAQAKPRYQPECWRLSP